MKRLIACVTIDTEADCNVRWQRRRPLCFESVCEGIPKALRPLFKQLGIRPVYFVSPLVANDNNCCRVLSEDQGRGAEIGNHFHLEELHPELNSPCDCSGKKFPCLDSPDEVEFGAIKETDALITKRLGVKPVSFRAGRFGADIQTIVSLSKLGYRLDSSVTPGIDWKSYGGPDYRGYPDQPYYIDLKNEQFNRGVKSSEVLEVPISIGRKRFPLLPQRWFSYQWLRPSHMFLFELTSLVRGLIKQNKNRDCVVLCVMFHSVEIIPGASPYARTRLDVMLYLRRLGKLLSYIKECGAEFMTLRQISDIYKNGA